VSFVWNSNQYEYRSGVWRCLSQAHRAHFDQFMREYQIVREAEGRRFTPDQLRRLPYGLQGDWAWAWNIRATGFEALLRHVVKPLAQAHPVLRILDLGAGPGWLAHRLAQRGWHAAAVDLLDNDWDGVAACQHYRVPVLPVQAAYDQLPFESRSIELVVYNASFHYAESFATVLAEGLRVLAPGGRLVILDSPLYPSAQTGQQMVAEREEDFLKRFGFRSDALKSQGFLTYSDLEQLGQKFGLRWRFYDPDYSLGWRLRPLRARLRGRRPPAQFRLIVA